MALHLGSGPRRAITSQEAAGPALEPGLTTPGYPRTPLPSKPPRRPPRASLSVGRLRTSLLPVAERGPVGPGEGETGHPPKSMAASLTEARAAPPPQGGECRAGATAQWAVPGGGTIGRALVPAQSQLPLHAISRRPPSAPRARALLTNEPTASRQPSPQRPLPALDLQPANRQVPAPPSRRCVPVATSLGPAPPISSLSSAVHLSRPSPALLPDHSVGTTH